MITEDHTNRAGLVATLLASAGLALAGIGIGVGTAHADPLPEDQIKQNCESRGGTYWTQIAPDGARESSCLTNDGNGLSCVDLYQNGERWGGSCNRSAPRPPTGT